jgi:predicted transcriptional regulator
MSSLVIERRDPDDELGLLVVSDIANHVIAVQRSTERVNVYEVMSKPVITLPEEMDIKYGIRLLVRFQLSRALVIDHDRQLCGLVTLRDMVLRYAERTR